MRSRIPPTVAALVAALIAVPRAAAPAPSIVYSIKSVEWHDPACGLSKSDALSCPHILFEYPVIERAPTPAAAAAINRAVREFLLTSIGEPRKYGSLKAAIEAFKEWYEDYKGQAGVPGAFWEDRIVAIIYLSPAIVSVKFDLSFFSGGLHPQYAATFTSFNASTGTRIRLDDVLVAGYRARLTRIAENEFRTQHRITPGMTLRDAGFIFFKNDTFALSDNFWFGPQGVTFFYNTYEIAPYSMGTTELLLSYGLIGELIRPDGLLRPMR
jgi:Protein of unknown function (DUF3298)